MSNHLTNKDYKQILSYYKQNIPKSKAELKIQAEKILGDKLCKCIKKVEPINESKSIGVCTRTVLNTKGFTRGKFNCTGKKRTIVLKRLVKKNKTKKIKSKK
jgi:hypothetical protein